MPPIRTSMVRLVSYRKEEYLDRHQPHAPPAADKRPFLFLLSPDTLELVTASDASADSQPPGVSLLQQVSLKGGDRTPRRAAARPLALLHKLAHGVHGEESGTLGSGAAAAAAEDAHPPRANGGEELGAELEEDQLLTFSVALSQVAGLECDERRIKILFCRQRPHRSTETNDEWRSLMKAVAFPVAYPYEGLKHRNFSVKGFMNRHYKDPFVSSVVVEADSPQEATALHRAVEEAIARLAQAVHWLSQDLPLDSKPVVTLVTATVAVPMDAVDDGNRSLSLGKAASSVLTSSVDQCASAASLYADTGREQIICPFPRLQQPLDVPIPAAEPDGDSGGKGLGSNAESGGGDSSKLVINVWLHSPLGPAVATIREEQLRQSAAAGGAPMCVVATPHDSGLQDLAAATGTVPAGKERLEVVLQFTAMHRPAVQRRSSRVLPQPSVAGSGNIGSGTVPAILAVLAVPLLAAWLQMLGDSGAPAIRVLQSVSFLLSCLAALAAIVVVQVKGRTSTPPPQAAEVPQPAGWWRLVLLHADLVQESRKYAAAGAPPIRRLVSSSPMSLAPSTRMALDGGAVELPPAIKRLVEEHPVILTDDIAARFLVGLGSGDKAYQALRNMVEWVEAQGVADLVHQPQPQFELIKKHYPQVLYCWSRSADCVLEVECTGRWRAAFEALRALGVTERELLRHQFFTMEYAFRVVDTRPLPQGKTVKIIDLEGLSMRDVSSAAFKWYLNVGGALLAVNYPQRLHKAFLLNAPAWSGVIWRVLAAVIPRRTREQLQLFTKNQRTQAAEALLQWVPADQLPQQYGGTCTVPLGESELEQEMLRYVRRLNQHQLQQMEEGKEELSTVAVSSREVG